MLKRSMFAAAAMFAVLLAPCVSLVAQEATAVKLPADSKLVVKMDMEAMQKSGFGKKLIELVMDRVMEEVADQFGIGVPDMDDVAGFIGFNPLNEARSMVLSASDFANPQDGLLAIISMKKTVGSIEAMLPSVPGYAVKTVGDHKIHSAKPQGDVQVHLAIHTCSEGNKTVVVATKEDLVSQQLARMEGKADSGLASFEYTACPGAMIDLHVLEIPADQLGDSPVTLIATMVHQIAFHLIDDSQKLKISFDLIAQDDGNAEQLDQMLQGLVPRVEGQISGFVDGLNVKRDGKTVSLNAGMDSKNAAQLLSDQFDGAVNTIQGMLGNR